MVDLFLVAFSALLLIAGSACAQVSAPNCTTGDWAWVSPLQLNTRFVKMTMSYPSQSLPSVLQLTWAGSMSGRSLPGIGV
jgi:hypothetical protein